MKGMNTRALVNRKRFPGQVEARGIEPCYAGEVSVQVRRDQPQLEPFSTCPAKIVHLTVHGHSWEKHSTLPKGL